MDNNRKYALMNMLLKSDAWEVISDILFSMEDQAVKNLKSKKFNSLEEVTREQSTLDVIETFRGRIKDFAKKGEKLNKEE